MKNMSSNRDLYEYISSFSSVLKLRGLKEMSDILDVAIGHASSSSTEFLGESRIALRRILNEENGALTGEERAAMVTVLEQIDKAFNRR
ncbi:MAG TPA: hypothetical protein VHN77_02135 [Phycisphaerales bacterium]|nr:hypothetical protein [Phycisphaerales bacterium]